MPANDELRLLEEARMHFIVAGRGGMMGDAIVDGTARLAIACYAARLLVDARSTGRTRSPRRDGIVRWLWTAGCGGFLLHVLAAYHFVHDWSHAAALAHTAERTAAVVGWNWGGGLWFNHAFAIVWTMDVALWWLRGRPRTRAARAWSGIAQVFMAFMVLNATVVFGPWWWKPIAAVYAAALAWNWRRRLARRRTFPYT